VPEGTDTRPPLFFWLVSLALLLWGLGGASIYVAYFVESPQQFAQTAEASEHRQAYAAYVASIPAWAIAVGIVAAVTRLLGAIALLLRRRWALPLFVVSSVFFLVALYRAFVLAGAGKVMGGTHIAIELAFVALGAFGVWFAYVNGSRGVLR
jgi:hypothetical protein